MSRLKPAYEAFCQSFVLTSNATYAAHDAGYKFDYASQQGYRLLRRAPIRARIAELRAEIAERECMSPTALLTKLESAFRTAMKQEHPIVAVRVIEAQAKVAALLLKQDAGSANGTAYANLSGAIKNMAKQLGLAEPALAAR